MATLTFHYCFDPAASRESRVNSKQSTLTKSMEPQSHSDSKISYSETAEHVFRVSIISLVVSTRCPRDFDRVSHVRISSEDDMVVEAYRVHNSYLNL